MMHQLHPVFKGYLSAYDFFPCFHLIYEPHYSSDKATVHFIYLYILFISLKSAYMKHAIFVTIQMRPTNEETKCITLSSHFLR